MASEIKRGRKRGKKRKKKGGGREKGKEKGRMINVDTRYKMGRRVVHSFQRNGIEGEMGGGGWETKQTAQNKANKS